MPYDPFARGTAPAGVTTTHLVDASRERRLPVEIWYPAAARHRGQDLDDQTADHYVAAPGLPPATQHAVRDATAAEGRFPLVVYCHGAWGHRRNASHLCTHLAARGYVVAAPDFTGDTAEDLQAALAAAGSAELDFDTGLPQILRDRRADVRFLLDSLLKGAGPAQVADLVDPERIGICGISLGGWTALKVVEEEDRIDAVLAVAVPTGSRGRLPQSPLLGSLLRPAAWRRPVPVLLLAGAQDAVISVDDLLDLHGHLAAPKQFAALRGAGHSHYNDDAEAAHDSTREMWLSGQMRIAGMDLAALAEASRPFAELCPAAHGGDTLRALCTGHMDAHLNGDPDARRFLTDDLTGAFRARGITLDVRA
ncbi:alpha/beta hydrolase family protein [Streptomyces griseorubiginosus]|uniref:alpha/beta hydrolase family protein n=1 Tax=Streptomyces griseorubiginosus TaxID=67304 RepID=UPI00369C2784